MKQVNKTEVEEKLNFQRGLIKEIMVIVAVIFTLAYFNLDPQEIWNSIVSLWEKLLSLFN